MICMYDERLCIVMNNIYIYPTVCDTRSIFNQSKAGFSSEFSFS